MNNIKNRLRRILNYYRIIPGWLLLQTVKQERKQIIFDEMEHWNKIRQFGNTGHFDMFSDLMVMLPEYRNLLQFRSGSGIIKLLLQFLFPPMDTLYICTDDIGPRLFIQHGFATMISARKIGSDCWINQQVTIGYKGSDEPPVIGNGVRITVGAKVLGNINLGDNSIVGANAVVIKNVPPNAIVGGVPAKIIGENKNPLYNPEA